MRDERDLDGDIAIMLQEVVRPIREERDALESRLEAVEAERDEAQRINEFDTGVALVELQEDHKRVEGELEKRSDEWHRERESHRSAKALLVLGTSNRHKVEAELAKTVEALRGIAELPNTGGAGTIARRAIAEVEEES